jgi:uncharacterized repeat protein (TIGR03806 family)
MARHCPHLCPSSCRKIARQEADEMAKFYLRLSLACLALSACAPKEGVRLDMILAKSPPAKLSAYGLFTDPAAKVAAPGVHAYRLNTALFSDYADKRRFVFVPPGQAITYKPEGSFEFPVGAVLVKTFEYPAKLSDATAPVRTLETRLLVRTETGWDARPYIWNAAGTEATLTPVGGPIPVDVQDAHGKLLSIAYRVPNQNQCKTCHLSAGALAPIGPKAANLNLDYAYPAGPENQLAHWSRLGILKGAPDPTTAPKLADFSNVALSAEARSRAWLEMNCAHCHKPDGSASNTGLFLTATTQDPAELGVGRRPVSAGKGSGDFLFDIVPGRPDESILVHRIKSTEPGVAMPELGRTLVHEEAVEVIRTWIAEMKPQ